MTIRAIILGALLLVCRSSLQAQTPDDFPGWATPLAGIYATSDGEHVIVTPHARFGLLSLFWLERGDVRALESIGDGGFAFGPGLYPREPFAGSVEFAPAADGRPAGLLLRIEGEPDLRATRLPMIVEEVQIGRGREATLAGLLVTPPGEGPFPAAVMIPSGYNDRYEHWRLAMALLARGIGSLVYDARLAGASTGEALPDHYYSRSLVRARDAAAVARWLRTSPRVDAQRTGVVGWSQGGWLGAIVAGGDQAVSFYVNIAANLNPGWQQQRHARLSDLRYEGFSEQDVDAARRYFDSYFGVMQGTVPWSDYVSDLAAVGETAWFDWLEAEGYSVVWASPQAAEEYADLEKENLPDRDLVKVQQPALGIYFEFDESTPSESAEIFVRGLTRGGNADFLLRSIPNTTHEAWIVPDHLRKDEDPPTRLAPAVFRLVADWVAERIRASERTPPPEP